MLEKFIAAVPSRIWSEGRPANARQWTSEFNVASWVRVSGPAGKVQLVVSYLDGKEDRTIVVDRAEVTGEGCTLLSGQIALRFSSAVEQVNICLRLSAPAMTHAVEELYMQRRGITMKTGDKLISNY